MQVLSTLASKGVESFDVRDPRALGCGDCVLRLVQRAEVIAAAVPTAMMPPTGEKPVSLRASPADGTRLDRGGVLAALLPR